MFPTVFAISIRGLAGSSTKIASSFLMMSPLGGLVGNASDGLLWQMPPRQCRCIRGALLGLSVCAGLCVDGYARQGALTISNTFFSSALKGPEAPSFMVHMAAAKRPASSYEAPLLRM